MRRAGKNVNVENILVNKQKHILYVGTNIAEGEDTTIFLPEKIIFLKNYTFPNDTARGTDILNDVPIIN